MAPSGYLRAVIADTALSPRRRAKAAPAALQTTFGYDRTGNLVSIVNPRGVETRVEVNQLNEPVVLIRGADISLAAASGQLTTGEAALAHVIRLSYDHNGRVVRREIENQGGTTPGVGDFVERTALFDILGNAVEATVEVDAAATARYRFRYDAEELLAVIEKPEGNRIDYTHDERNLLFTTTRGAGSSEASTTRRDYDLNGNLVRLVDAEDQDGDGQGEAETAVYDGFDRPIEVIDALGNRLVTTHDPASNVIRRRLFGHPPGRPDAEPVLLSDIMLERDELSRIFRIDQALFVGEGFTPQKPVDLRDRDGNGRVTTHFEHDALSRPTFLTEDDGQVTRTVYDGASRVLEWHDAAGNRRVYEYDRNSNPTTRRVFERSSGDLVAEQEFVTFMVWDQLDRLVQVSADHTTRYTYDSRDNIIAVSDGCRCS